MTTAISVSQNCMAVPSYVGERLSFNSRVNSSATSGTCRNRTPTLQGVCQGRLVRNSVQAN